MEADAQPTLSGLEIVSTLYRATSTRADFHSPEIVERLHIRTPVDDAIVKAANQRRVVLVTGNTGDGKTHLIRRIQEEFPKDTEINVDANESENTELIQQINHALQERRPLVMAINEGILLEVCEQAQRKHEWAGKVIGSILKPFDYGDGVKPPDSPVSVFDLNLRNNLAEASVASAIDHLTRLVPSAPGLAEPVLQANAERLRHPEVTTRVCKLLDVVGRSGFHATMRDLMGFVAYLLCGGESTATGIRPYYLNAFNGGVGPLFDRVRQLDPIRLPSPFLDDRLYSAEDTSDEWLLDAPDEMREAGNLDSFRSRKRRAYFEHTDGIKILRTAVNEVDERFNRLRDRDENPEVHAIGLLNRFFTPKDTHTDRLVLWLTHKYHARTPRFMASRQHVDADRFEIRIPRLPGALAEAFPQFYPDHAVLVDRQMTTNDGLFVDRRLVQMLLEGDRVSGLGIRNAEAMAKVSSFYDRLARLNKPRDYVIRILRLDTMAETTIGVNLGKHAYYLPGDAT